jgi:hypothetical protein
MQSMAKYGEVCASKRKGETEGGLLSARQEEFPLEVTEE